MIEAGARTSLWRVPGMRAFVALTLLGFASYYSTLASLPAYAVAGGADQDSAGIVTTVFLCVTIVGQLAIPALTTRFGAATYSLPGAAVAVTSRAPRRGSAPDPRMRTRASGDGSASGRDPSSPRRRGRPPAR